MIVTTMDGVEHVYQFTKNLFVHGGKKPGVDALEGLRDGTPSPFTTAERAQAAVEEFDDLGDEGLKITEGIVTDIDRRKKEITIEYANGRTETLQMTNRAAAEGGAGIEESSERRPSSSTTRTNQDARSRTTSRKAPDGETPPPASACARTRGGAWRRARSCALRSCPQFAGNPSAENARGRHSERRADAQRILKSSRMVTITSTGRSPTRAGVKRHSRAAMTASSSNPRSSERVTRMATGMPSRLTTTSSPTVPWICCRIAATVYCGFTCFRSVGGVTPPPKVSAAAEPAARSLTHARTTSRSDARACSPACTAAAPGSIGGRER